MNQCDRLRIILLENNLKQKQLANALGITESYVSKLLRDPNIRISQPLATLIEGKYGYRADWVINGTGEKLAQVSNNALSVYHQRALAQLAQMSDDQVRAVLAFIQSLENIEKSLTDTDTGRPPHGGVD